MADQNIILPRRDREVEVLYEARMGWFRELGFTRMQREILTDLQVDHHRAQDLLEAGCPVELAFKLLT